MKKWLSLIGILIIALIAFFWFSKSEKQEQAYGVFIGMEKEELFDLSGSYDDLVLDATYLEKSDLEKLGETGQQIFAYLNVGALEKSNSFYSEFKDLTFKPYDNWPDEAWLDVTDSAWQEFLVGTLTQDLKEKGLDGLFLDNFDVYDHDHRPEVYETLLKFLKEFNEMDLKVIINGGSTFVSQLVADDPGLAKGLIYAVNQESVYLAYDFDADQPVEQKQEDEDFYLDYLEQVSAADIHVFLIEYGADQSEAEEILKSCQDLGYTVYFSPNILLNEE